jgi:hypothetical protein
MVRREAFVQAGGFDPSYSIVADWDCWLRLVTQGAFIPVDHPLLEYRVAAHNIGQMSGDPWMAYLETLSVYRRHQFRAERAAHTETLTAITAGRRKAKRMRARQAVARFVDSVSASGAEWEMLGVAARIDPVEMTRVIARRGARRLIRRHR